MSKNHDVEYRGSWEYADCLEKSFGTPAASPAGAASGGGGAAGGSMGNTPLCTSHLGEMSEDTAHISMWVDYGLRTEEFFEALELCYREAQGKAEAYMPGEEEEGGFGGGFAFEEEERDTFAPSPDDNITTDDKGWFSFGGFQWKMSPRGIGGKKSNDIEHARAFYKYVIRMGGMLIAFRKDRAETVSNVWIEIGSVPLALNGGLSGAWADIRQFFEYEQFRIEREILSRVDMYKDIEGVHVGEFCEKMMKGCRVNRARSLAYHADDLNTGLYLMGDCYTGFSVGKSIRLRCYDKRKEMQHDAIKWGVFSQLYDGIPEVLTRIEFQLRRKALSEFFIEDVGRIDGVESYLKVRERLWKYLTEDWFRLTEDEVDKKNNHQSRAKTWDVWGMVQTVVDVAGKAIFRMGRDFKIDMDHLGDMALGCLAKMATFEGKGRTLKDVLNTFVEYVKTKVGLEKFKAVMNQKHEEWALLLGYSGES